MTANSMVKRLFWGLVFLSMANSGWSSSLDVDLVRVHYDLELTGYCGLTTDQAQRGFHEFVNHVMISRNLNQNDLEQARMQAWKDVYYEWQNRGLGGFRGWCKNEGHEAVERLEAGIQFNIE